MSDNRRKGIEIELEFRSRGFQWFFSFYLVFLVESGGRHKDAILLIDEPGLHLHPMAQQKLIRVLDGNLLETASQILEEIGQEQVAAFGLDGLIVVDLIHRDQPVSDDLKPRIIHLLEKGIIERVGRGRGVRLLLSRQFYRHIGQAGVYTRKRGLDRETNKELLLKHIQDNRKEGSQLRELVQVLPALKYVQVQKLLQELRIKGQIHKVGNTCAARWYPGGPPSGIMPKNKL